MAEMLTPQELASYLKLNPTTVIRKAAKGEIPAIRIGRQFRFNRDQIERWLLRQTIGRPAQILVVDDDPAIGKLFQNGLGEEGYDVTTTVSSLDALKLVNENKFDLLFIDLVMPEINGCELFRRVREIDKSVPVAIITAYPDSQLMEEAMKEGPFIVMKKPLDINNIRQATRNFTQGPAANTEKGR